MNEARISEVFLSYQGEGPYLGTKQLFIRFYGCSFNCAYCDTKPLSYNTFTKEGLLGKISECSESYHSISLTGGEPLEQADFIRDCFVAPIPRLRSGLPSVAGLLAMTKVPIYLETNGILYKELEKIIDFVDIIAMDIKLPSSTEKNAFWGEHRRFLEIAGSKDVFVKAIIAGQTDIEDLIKAKDIVKNIDKKIPFILQPVDPVKDIKEPSFEMLMGFKRELDRGLDDVRIMKQWHKVVGIK